MNVPDVMVLTSEFGAVEVQVEPNKEGTRLRITDLATQITSYLDPIGVLPWGELIPNEMRNQTTTSLDTRANGPRLRISHPYSNSEAYVDPLELSDAAVTGTWHEFPPAYDGGRVG